MSGRPVVVGLAHARSAWAAELSRWCTGGTLAIDLAVCLTADELRSVLALRPVDAVLLDGRSPGPHAELVAAAHRHGAAVVGVGTCEPAPQWALIGADAVLPDGFSARELTETLLGTVGELAVGERTRTRARAEAPTGPPPEQGPGGGHHELLGRARSLHGRLVGVSGPGGSGASVVAMAIAQGLAGGDGDVSLVDGARRAALAMYHDAGDVVPGLSELIEATDAGIVDPESVRALHTGLDDRDYRLLLGLRRPSEAAAHRSGSTGAALDAVRRAFDLVVVDHDVDLDTGPPPGHAVLADRHAVALHVLAVAEVMVLVTGATTRGVHDVVHRLDELVEAGFPPQRILVCCNRAERSAVGRPALQHAIRHLGRGRFEGRRGPAMVVVPQTRRVGSALRDGVPLPRGLVDPLTRAVRALLDAGPRRSEDGPTTAASPAVPVATARSSPAPTTVGPTGTPTAEAARPARRLPHRSTDRPSAATGRSRP